MRWPWQRQAGPEADLVRAAVAELAAKAASGSQYVLIGRVLQLLDPEHKLAPAPRPPDPREDPVFGTMPVDPAAYREDP